jgi:phosphomannomutase
MNDNGAGTGLDLSCFKAYDIRGRMPDQLNENIAYRVGLAFVTFTSARSVVVGRDVRLSSPALCDALTRGLREAGADVFDIGLCGTEEVYFATFDRQFDGGIMVTASHNPADYNGMKLVREQARPISADTGLGEIRDLVRQGHFVTGNRPGGYEPLPDARQRYLDHVLRYIDVQELRPLKLVVNAGNGCAGPVLDGLEQRLPLELVKVHHEPDGTFPNGIPNPLLPERREATVSAIKAAGADFGLAWDGDFDRCFFFDGDGRFIEGYYLVGLLASELLIDHPGEGVVYDPRLTWNTEQVVKERGGMAIMSRSGHAFIKEKMREVDAVYGGEMSAHHYFREFSYCDSGMIPWLLVARSVSRSHKSLAELVQTYQQAFPCSGEINFQVADANATIERVLSHFGPQKPDLSFLDGVSASFADWRFNLRASNTEPLIRLNVETRHDTVLLEQRTEGMRALIESS